METRLARKELQVAFSNLNNADLNNMTLAAQDFLDHIANNSEVADIVAALPASDIDIEQWQKNLYNSDDLELPRNMATRVSFMLSLLEYNKKDLAQASTSFRVGSRKIIDHIRAYIDTLVKPVYQYIDNELHKKELAAEPVSHTSITATNAVVINGSNYGSISQTNNEALGLLSELSSILQSSAKLTDDEKLAAVSNVDTIKNQIVSPKPNNQIIKLAWKAVSAAADTAGATDLVAKLVTLISQLSS